MVLSSDAILGCDDRAGNTTCASSTFAGGLNAGNVRRAIDEVQPFGVDLCSGVRTNGKLDEKKLNAFFRAAGY